MPFYAYRARNSEGALVKGSVESPDRETLEGELSASGLIPISVSESRGSPLSFDIARYKSIFESVTPEDIIIFTRQIGTMYRVGVPFVRAINAVTLQTENESLRKVLVAVREDVEEGATLADALSKHPGVFGELYIGMVEAGEAGGVLEEMFERLSILLEKENEITSKVKSATLYPKIVVFALFAAAFILVSFVVPKFAKLYGKFGADLPLPTKILIALSDFTSNYWYILILLIVTSLFSFRMFIRNEKGRRWWDNIRLKVPIFGPLSLKASMSRFSRILGTLLASGLPILTALDKSSAALENIVISAEIERVKDEIRRGTSFYVPLEGSPFFPAMLTQMVAVGEESGRLDEMLIGAADQLDGEIDYTIRNLSTLLEPILLFIIFGMVLFLALALFLPMWDMARLAR